MYVVGMIHNQKLDKWHPVFFSDHPHSADTETVWRFKSRMHHTLGFDTRDDAIKNANGELLPGLGHARTFLDVDFQWNGEGVPAIVHFFDISVLPKYSAVNSSPPRRKGK